MQGTLSFVNYEVVQKDVQCSNLQCEENLYGNDLSLKNCTRILKNLE